MNSPIFLLEFVIFSLSLLSIETNGNPQQQLTVYPKLPDDPGDDVPPENEEPEPENKSGGYLEIIKGDADCICGRPRLTGGRIVGGELAKINELPWTVAVTYSDGSAFCGGTLICDRYVITAAHCMEYIESPRALQVRLMEQDFDKSDENDQSTLKINIVEIIKHPEWNPKKIDNDVTLLKLETPVDIGQGDHDTMTPVCLPANNDELFADVMATVAGWGATETGARGEKHLRKVNVPIFAQQECKDNTVYKKYLTANMMCAGYLEGERDACQGDSGGPLVVENSGKYTLAGVVSFGSGCAEPNAPGVYARVGRFADWILEETQDCQFCKS